MSYTSINRVIIVGRLTREPELRALPSGRSVCSIRIACNSSRRDADGGYQERPCFFDVSVFGGTAESLHRYMSKGSRVAVDGRLDWREWESAEGQRRQSVSIIADAVEFLDSPGGWRGDGDAPEGDPAAERELAGVGAAEEVPF